MPQKPKSSSKKKKKSKPAKDDVDEEVRASAHMCLTVRPSFAFQATGGCSSRSTSHRGRHGAVVLLGAVEESNWSSGDAAAAADTGRWTRQECHWSWCADVCAAHTRRHTRLRSRFHAAERVACRLCSPSTQFRGVYTCQAIPMHALVTPQRLRRLFSPHRFPAWRAAVSPPHRPREDGLAHPAHTSISNLAAALGLPPRWRLSKPYSVPLTASFVVRRRWS
jgi:hypothetical protein